MEKYYKKISEEKVSLKRPTSSVDQSQRESKVLVENVRSHAEPAKQSVKRPTDFPPKKIKFVEPDIPMPPPVVSTDLADNPYAQEIFMCKTNIRDVARENAERRGCATTEKVLRAFRKKLYRLYASEPKDRIREPLDKVRFVSQYYEYRFFLALHKPLHSEEQYQEYKEQLEAAGITESWVSMRQRNRLLLYEDVIIKKVSIYTFVQMVVLDVEKSFNKWSGKLDKLDFYLMDLHSRQPRPASPPKVAALKPTADDQLLDNLLNRSNAKERLAEAQIRTKFDLIKYHLLAPKKVRFQWLIFDDDDQNKRFQLGTHRSEPIAEVEAPDFVPSNDSTASSSRPCSVASGDSEIAQMRSEMAMTQPQELLPMEGSRFTDTNELANALGLAEEPSMPEMEKLDEPLIEPNQVEAYSSPMITPAQADVVEISDSPVKEDALVEIKEEFIFTLEYMKKFTNIEQFVMYKINQESPRTAKNCMRHIDSYVEKYYELKKSMLLKNVLPKELRMLTRRERREREAKAATPMPVLNQSSTSTSATEPLEPPRISPTTETPSVPRVPRKSRLIVYSDDEEELPIAPPAEVPDTMPFPHSEDFLPSAFSTQLPGDSGVPPRRQDTPFQSPVRQATPQCVSASSSRGRTPAFISHSPDTTIIANTNHKSPKTPSIKRELNTTSYEGEVEFIELNDAPIVINDSMNATSQNIPELLGRQPSCLVAFPEKLQGLVNTLFQKNNDATLSQESKSSSDSGRSRLSQDTGNVSVVPSMGFHNAKAPTENVEKS